MPETVTDRAPQSQAARRSAVCDRPERRAQWRGMGETTDLDPVVSAYLAHWIRGALRSESARSLGTRLGVTHATISMVSREQQVAGSKLLVGVARLENKSPAQIEADAVEWARATPPVRPAVKTIMRPTLDRIPDYEATEKLARARAPYLPEEAWARVRAMAGADVADLTPELLVGFATTWAQAIAGRLREMPDDGDRPPPVKPGRR